METQKNKYSDKPTACKSCGTPLAVANSSKAYKTMCKDCYAKLMASKRAKANDGSIRIRVSKDYVFSKEEADGWFKGIRPQGVTNEMLATDIAKLNFHQDVEGDLTSLEDNGFTFEILKTK